MIENSLKIVTNDLISLRCFINAYVPRLLKWYEGSICYRVHLKKKKIINIFLISQTYFFQKYG